MEISKMITKRRKKLHISQQQLAEKIKVTDIEVARWETGKTLPEAEVLPVLAEALCVNVDQLVGDTSKENILNGVKEKINYSKIARYKIFVTISFALLLVAISFSLISFSFVLLFIICSIVTMIIGIILYQTFYKDLLYTKIYKRLLVQCVVPYVLILFFLYTFITFFIFGYYVGPLALAVCCLVAVAIAMPIIFEKKGYNLSVKNKKIFYISTGILWLLLILCYTQFIGSLNLGYYQEATPFILVLIFLIIFFLNYFYYGFKTDIKD